MGQYGIDFIPLDHKTDISTSRKLSPDTRQKLLEIEQLHFAWIKHVNELADKRCPEPETAWRGPKAPLEFAALQLYPMKE